MALLYLITGVIHFLRPGFYLDIMPAWLPMHEACNNLAGVAEIAFAVLLVIPRYQSLAAWLIGIMLLIFLLVIHIPLIFRFHGIDDVGWWINIIRLPIQYVLVRWALSYVGPRTVNLFDTSQN